MCEFVSFVFVPATEEVFAGSLDSHSGIEAGWDLKPGSYRECEWTQDDDGKSLVVRTEADDPKPAYFKSLILAHFPTRKALLKHLTVGKAGDATYYFRNGKLHRDGDEPAVVWAAGTKSWYRNGKRHRAGDKPAIVWADGTKMWYRNDKRHRDGDKPAVVWADGTKEWWRNDKRHRDGDKPAVVGAAGTKSWYRNGKRHRAGDKPAIVWADGTKEWWRNDKRQT